MDVYEFGARLIRTQDLDPVYTALVGAKLAPDLLSRFCLAYWCFYSLNTACRVCEKPREYWPMMMRAAINEEPGNTRWPRGAERRHFRGEQAVKSIQELRQHDPHKLVTHWVSGGTFQEVAKRVKAHRGFGDWIAFKVADMSERVFGRSTSFADCYLGIYKDPVQGAALVRFGDWKHPISPEELKATYDELVKGFRKFKAPPHFDRPINLQEAETVCCKYKSFTKKHYYIGKDIDDYRDSLEAVKHLKLAQRLLEHMPEKVS